MSGDKVSVLAACGLRKHKGVSIRRRLLTVSLENVSPSVHGFQIQRSTGSIENNLAYSEVAFQPVEPMLTLKVCLRLCLDALEDDYTLGVFTKAGT